MLTGAHVIIYSTDAEADRAFLRDVLDLPSVDAGDGWLIFALPPGELAIHPAEDNVAHELYLMSDDIHGFVAHLESTRVACEPISEQSWGLLTHLTLPGGSKLGIYEPRHVRPEPPADV